MKKLIALLMVLAMTASASALVSEVQIWVDGELYEGGDVYPSDIISIVLLDSTNALLQNVNVGTETAVSNGDSYAHAWAPSAMFPNSAFTVDGDGYTWAGNAGWFGVSMPADDVVFEQTFHVPDDTPGSTWILIEWDINYAGDGGDAPYSGSQEIHVAPEPATIALLGLGGLFLRRRRKA